MGLAASGSTCRSSSAWPVIGTNIALETINVPAAATIGLTLFGFQDIPNGFDLTPIGMPGCSQYVQFFSSSVWLPTSGTGSTPFNIPNSNVYAGVQVTTQAAAIVQGVNPFGALASNGLRLLIDIN